jgi:hypothetical protein
VVDELVPTAAHVTEQYRNNRIEADHGRLNPDAPIGFRLIVVDLVFVERGVGVNEPPVARLFRVALVVGRVAGWSGSDRGGWSDGGGEQVQLVGRPGPVSPAVGSWTPRVERTGRAGTLIS